MQTATKSSAADLWQELIRNLSYDLYEEEEVQSIIEDINSLHVIFRQKALALCVSLSYSAGGLVPNVLRRIKTATKSLSQKETERWIIHAFDLFESQGIDSFFRFLSRIDEEALNRFKMQQGLHLQTVNSLLETYLHGISGKELKITAGDESYTDTDTIFLPPVLNRFHEPEKNFLLYKLMAVFHWARIEKNTLIPDESILRFFLNDRYSKDSDIAEIFLSFPERIFANDLYAILDSFRIKTFLKKELSGLMREADGIQQKLFSERPVPETLPEKAAFVEGLYQYFLAGHIKGTIPELLKKLIPQIDELREADGPHQALRILSDVYKKTSQLGESYSGTT